ncbi:S8 family serine peptidase [Mesomycoplasma hyopneumoniae]
MVITNKIKKGNDSTQLAYNAISVGSTKYRENSFLNDIEISNFSNRELESNHLNLPKPLVVAPGEILLENNDEIRGTSFAAPVVTGAISYTFDKFSWLNNDQFRVPSAMSILAASAHLPKYKNLNKTKI